MISLDEFKEYLLFIREERNKQDVFCSALETLSPGNYCNCFMFDGYENAMLQLLASHFPCGKENALDCIYNFVYDLRGLDNRSLIVEDQMKCPTYITKDNGECMLYYSADTLYEYLMRYNA